MGRQVISSLRERLLEINPAEVSFSVRGFHSNSGDSREQLEDVGRAFLDGYHAALRQDDVRRLGNDLAAVRPEVRGFAFEGAAMALALLDNLLPARQGRWQSLLADSGSEHCYVLHVGYGWAVARLPWLRWNLPRRISRFDSLLAWLVVDGFGFHEGYFQWSKWYGNRQHRRPFSGYASRVFDQGLGRSLWFVGGADVVWIADTVGSFASDRRSDLWSGVGLACAYAGCAMVSELHYLKASAGTYYSDLCQGIAFGAEARVRAGIANECTERTCLTICGMDASAAAELTRTTKPTVGGIAGTQDYPRYEQWRNRIRDLMTEEVSV